MNERIKELAEFAKFYIDVSNDPNSPFSWWAAGHNECFEKSDENSSRSFAKNQKRQWIDLEIMEEAAEFERNLFDQLGSKDEEMNNNK